MGSLELPEVWSPMEAVTAGLVTRQTAWLITPELYELSAAALEGTRISSLCSARLGDKLLQSSSFI